MLAYANGVAVLGLVKGLAMLGVIQRLLGTDSYVLDKNGADGLLALNFM